LPLPLRLLLLLHRLRTPAPLDTHRELLDDAGSQ
jgi:hypothetical protein